MLLIENVNPAVCDRTPDRNRIRVVIDIWGNPIQRNDAGRLSLAEHVDVLRRMRELFLPRARNVRAQRLAGGKQQTQFVVEQPPPRFSFQTGQDLDAVAMERGHRVHHSDVLLLDQFKQRQRILPLIRGGNYYGRAL